MRIPLTFFYVLMVFVATAQKKAVPLKVISYNIRYNNTGDGINAWPNRKDNVKGLVRFYAPDIFCVQEAMYDQLEQLLENTNFAVEGVGREDGIRKGEFSALYYDKTRFTRKDGGNFWLSITPDVPSIGWDAALRRVCTWVKLYDKLNRKEFMVFNVHYDHVGVQSRINAALLVREKIQQIAPGLPVIFTGDLNTTPETEAISTIKSFMKDTRDITAEPPYGPWGTFNGFKLDSDLARRIDYIFVNDKFRVQKYAVLSDSKELRYYSDHLPVFSEVWFK